MRTLVAWLALSTLAGAVSTVASAQGTFSSAGDLAPRSGTGRVDMRVYAPDMFFPLELPAYANSQVYGYGGFLGTRSRHGTCDARNYRFPWRDNFCETRRWDVPMCPGGTGHQGQDIRPKTCERGVHPALAAATGQITSTGKHYVYLTAIDGTRYDYLHLDMNNLEVEWADKIGCGEPIGYVSDDFFDSEGERIPTSIHLHFNIQQAVRGYGNTYVPPYTSLVEAYRRAEKGESTCVMPDAGVDAGVDAASYDASGIDAGPDAYSSDATSDAWMNCAVASCTACNDLPGCDWCASSNTCAPTDSIACGTWWTEQSSCEPCDASECGSCATSGFCAWCPGSGCVNVATPEYLECSSPIDLPNEC